MLLELFELASNNALQHDPESLQRLVKLQGQTMHLHIRPIEQSLYVSCHPHGMEFSRELTGDVDVTLSVSIAALLKISRDGVHDADLQPGELKIAGDPIVGQRFAQVVSDLDIDWEAFLAEHLGDTPAHFITLASGMARQMADESKLKFRSYLKNLLNQEMQILVAQPEVDDFLNGVDVLRADTDRLNSRLKRLQAQR